NFVCGGNGGDVLNGLGGDDLLDGGAGNDFLIGDEGNDLLVGGGGADYMDGGNGADTVSYMGSSGVTIYLNDSSSNLGDAAGDSFSNIEVFELSDLGDAFYAGDGLSQSDGSKTGVFVHGRGGADLLAGSIFQDFLSGDDGAD